MDSRFQPLRSSLLAFSCIFQRMCRAVGSNHVPSTNGTAPEFAELMLCWRHEREFRGAAHKSRYFAALRMTSLGSGHSTFKDDQACVWGEPTMKAEAKAGATSRSLRPWRQRQA